jgi:hypothetical protein
MAHSRDDRDMADSHHDGVIDELLYGMGEFAHGKNEPESR